MLRVLYRRPCTRVLALALQLCVAWTSVSALLHTTDDDPACSPALVLHDHNAHQVGAATESTPQPEHCFICHNLSLRLLVADAAVSSPAVLEQQIGSAASLHAGITLAARRPARAPPLV